MQFSFIIFVFGFFLRFWFSAERETRDPFAAATNSSHLFCSLVFLSVGQLHDMIHALLIYVFCLHSCAQAARRERIVAVTIFAQTQCEPRQNEKKNEEKNKAKREQKKRRNEKKEKYNIIIKQY